MKIYSRFQDYYDCVQKNHFDRSGVIWERKSYSADKKDVEQVLSLLNVEQERNYINFLPRDKIVLKNGYFVDYRNKLMHSCLACLVCVAGKVYPMIETFYRHHTGVDIKTFFDFESFDHSEGSSKFYNNTTYPKDSTYPKWFFSLMGKECSPEAWTLLNAPLFIVRPLAGDWRSIEYSIEVNPNLKYIDFFKVLNPYTIWQEIEMFLNNQLVQEKDPGSVPDEYRYQQLGFDSKWSFRTYPEI